MIWVASALLLAGLGFVVMILISDDNDDIDKGEELYREEKGKTPAFIESYLQENAVEVPPQVVNAVLAILVSAMVVCIVVLPWKYTLLAVPCVPGIGILIVKITGSYRRQKMLEQLPSFINQVTRRLSAGISVENAISDSVETLERPLGTVMRRVVRRVRIGTELHQAFEREARHNQVHEFDMLATALRINEQYGGSIRNILDDIVDILRMQDAGKRELSAMTGETRFTAVVLAIMPPLIAGYMFSNNPEFLLSMWSDTGGQKILIAAVAFQVMGMVAIWRMVKNIDA